MATACTPATEYAVDLVPLPQQVQPIPGAYAWPAQPVIQGVGGTRAASLFDGLTWSGQETADLRLVRTEDLEAESYLLQIADDGVRISAGDDAGEFYGLQTLRQIVDQQGADGLPFVRITDGPRFEYRGLQLDVGRHFFDVAFIKKYLDLMARYKLNTFHWHLTEDQGWRVQIDAYPRLTQVGSCRAETILEKNFRPYAGDGTPHCGAYTKDQIREVVAYAAERHIQVIPEIEMPGHASAALASYPEFGCTEGPYEVSTVWGIHDNIFCPSEETFAFLEGVLDEVLELFPSPYIHIGADEVPKTQWQDSAVAQEVMEREGLGSEEELQSWFVRRIERFLSNRGRTLVGWDEILEGGLAPNAVVMSWRGTDGGIAAARQGHDVIMTPTRHLYFDFYQGPAGSEPISADWSGYPLPLEQVYAFDPVPEVLSEEEARRILGAQGNVWTEYMKTPDKVEYMVLPRGLALAEMAWTPQERRDYGSFLARLPRQLDALAVAGYNFRPLD